MVTRKFPLSPQSVRQTVAVETVSVLHAADNKCTCTVYRAQRVCKFLSDAQPCGCFVFDVHGFQQACVLDTFGDVHVCVGWTLECERVSPSFMIHVLTAPLPCCRLPARSVQAKPSNSFTNADVYVRLTLTFLT